MRQSRAHDPARKRRGFFLRRRTNKLIRAPRVETVLDQERAIVDGAALIGEVEMSCAVITKTLKAIAPLLWSADYTDIVQEELACLAQMGVLDGAAAAKACAPRSTYAQRALYKDLGKRCALELEQMRSIAASSLRQANQQTYPFTVCARSVAMLMRRSTTFDWADKLKNRMVLSKPTTIKLVRYMMECKPGVHFQVMHPLSFFIFDQCYRKKGKSRGQHRAAERVDASGDLIALVSIVIVNSLELHVPALLAGGICPRLSALLQLKGPYTRPFTDVMPALEPNAVRASLLQMTRETGCWILDTADAFNLNDVSQHTIASMARALAGRPNLQISKSPITFHKPIIDCDTKAHKDAIKFMTFFETKTPKPHGVIILAGDGQSMMMYVPSDLPPIARTHRHRLTFVCIIVSRTSAS